MKTAASFDPILLNPRRLAGGHGHALHIAPLPPVLIAKTPETAAQAPHRRTKIWELSRNLHCSIVGTCLSSGELRQVLTKASVICYGLSEHDLHGQGVLLAARHDNAAKLLHKALDKRHRMVINQFDAAKTVEQVRILWQEAVKRGEIPGAYWAALTHAATNEALIRDVFGEVHMLSHLVGAANRADIRRLSVLEAENGELREKLRRQQDQLREGLTSRDAKIRDLSDLLARQIAEDADRRDASGDASNEATLAKLVGDLERRLTAERNRRVLLERRLEQVLDELGRERAQTETAARTESVLREELAAVEKRLLAPEAESPDSPGTPTSLHGVSLLYVGGRPNQLSHLRAFSEQRGATFLQHDGGVEDRTGLLAGLVSRADVVMFPVDCVSHEAVAIVKRLCRQAAKPYMPLRSAGMSSFVAALGRPVIAGHRIDSGALASV